MHMTLGALAVIPFWVVVGLGTLNIWRVAMRNEATLTSSEIVDKIHLIQDHLARYIRSPEVSSSTATSLCNEIIALSKMRDEAFRTELDHTLGALSKD